MTEETSKNPDHKGHELVDNIVYGPVVSRRYGKSLGINILPPNQKICSFDCLYCQLGWNSSEKNHSINFHDTESVVTSLQKYFNQSPENKNINSIVLSGNGEPTLNPDFNEIASGLSVVRNQITPEAKLICLTNGTTLSSPHILKTMSLFDECCVKFDANLKTIDKPHAKNWGF